jgi:hypothetical protein
MALVSLRKKDLGVESMFLSSMNWVCSLMLGNGVLEKIAGHCEWWAVYLLATSSALKMTRSDLQTAA